MSDRQHTLATDCKATWLPESVIRLNNSVSPIALLLAIRGVVPVAVTNLLLIVAWMLIPETANSGVPAIWAELALSPFAFTEDTT